MIEQQPSMAFDIKVAIPMFILWIVTIIGVFIFLRSKKRKSFKLAFLFYAISLLMGGFILGGIPNAVLPIQQIITAIKLSPPFSTILPMIMILIMLLATGLIFGRIFCGFVCPVGAIQELLSKISFKSDIKSQKSAKLALHTKTKTSFTIRLAFLIVGSILTLVWSISVFQHINPFTGLRILRVPDIMAIIIPVITLGITTVVSIFIYRPWCRFFCPFGALSSLSSIPARYKIRRNDDCNNCRLCEKICPTQEAQRDSAKMECYLCGRCIEICPKNALKYEKKT